MVMVVVVAVENPRVFGHDSNYNNCTQFSYISCENVVYEMAILQCHNHKHSTMETTKQSNPCYLRFSPATIKILRSDSDLLFRIWICMWIHHSVSRILTIYFIVFVLMFSNSFYFFQVIKYCIVILWESFVSFLFLCVFCHVVPV